MIAFAIVESVVWDTCSYRPFNTLLFSCVYQSVCELIRDGQLLKENILENMILHRMDYFIHKYKILAEVGREISCLYTFIDKLISLMRKCSCLVTLPLPIAFDE